jgi:uncharacterized protein YegP (UPF0339 family)
MATFQVKINENDEYHFNLVSDLEDLILRSESYSSKSACLNGIESVQSNADDEDRYERMVAEDGQFYFNLKAKNGEIIGTSTLYDTDSLRDQAIENLKALATAGEIKNIEESEEDF